MPDDFNERENNNHETFQYFINEYYNKLQSKKVTPKIHPNFTLVSDFLKFKKISCNVCYF